MLQRLCRSNLRYLQQHHVKHSFKLPSMSIGSTSSHKADVDYHTKALPAPVVELPPVPKYPCPFITDVDVERYLKPLYSTGWGISRVPAILSPPKGKPVPAATQLSKKISLPNSHLAEVFIEDAKTFIIEPENHHGVWNKELDEPGNYLTMHVHTHSAIAPESRRNTEDTDELPTTKTRPGITHRDIRFALLLDSLIKDYVHHRLLAPQTLSLFPQPSDIDAIHNFIPSISSDNAQAPR